MMIRHPNLLLVPVFLALTAATLMAQVRDPFAPKTVPGDPFAQPRQPLRGNPITFQCTVLDYLGQPVAGASILIAGGRQPTLTDKAGVAQCRTTDRHLATVAKGVPKTVEFTIVPPRDRLMPRIHPRVPLEELKPLASLTFRGRQAVRLSGKVIGKQDQQPVRHVRLWFSRKGLANPKATKFYTSTDDDGTWSIIVPRVDSQVVAAGSIAGYEIGNDREYKKTVEIAEDAESIEVPAFEIEQIPPRVAWSFDEGGQPIRDTNVRIFYARWLDDEIVTWEALSASSTVNEEGRSVLNLYHAPWTHAVVMARGEMDGVPYVGRTEIDPQGSELIEVRMHPLARVAGRLIRGDKPAVDTGVVIYESFETPGKEPGWKTIGQRGKTRTGASGEYEFSVERGVRYVVALERRDRDGRQTVLHRTADKIGREYDVPQVDLSAGE